MDRTNEPTHDWCEVESMIYRYRVLLGWSITVGPDELALSGGSTVCSADLPIGLACEVQAALTRQMLDGPVVLVPGRQHRWLLLASPPDEEPVPARPLPGVDLRVVCDEPIPLPPSMTRHGPMRWVVPPVLSRRCLPPLSAIVAATRVAVSVSSPALTPQPRGATCRSTFDRAASPARSASLSGARSGPGLRSAR